MSEKINDKTGNYYCPYCGNSSFLAFMEIPRHRRMIETDNGEFIEYMPEIRDYTCGICGFEFALDPDQE